MIVIIANREEPGDLQKEIEMIAEVKDSLKKNDIALEICKEYGFEPDIIDGIAIEFGNPEEVDASAKTIDARVFLNSNLLKGSFNEIMRYAIHELVHALQHMKREGPADPYEKMDYLDRPDELEAFQYQIKFENDVHGEDEAEDYVDDLIEYLENNVCNHTFIYGNVGEIFNAIHDTLLLHK